MSNDPEKEPELVKQEDLPDGIILRDHVVDGIQEYDQRLPMWWLMILFGVMIYSVIYWVVLDDRRFEGGANPALDEELQAIESIRLANSIDVTNDELFWEMAGNPTFVNAGKATYDAFCFACHGPDLQGGIGFNLVDAEWVHGSRPSEIYITVSQGAPDKTKGMVAWEPQLGQKKVAEVVAYVLSKNPGLKP